MADVRTARRNAEKAARDAPGRHPGRGGRRAGGGSGAQQEASAGVAAAAEKGRQLLEAAQLEAAALLDRAQAQVAEADTGYASDGRPPETPGGRRRSCVAWAIPLPSLRISPGLRIGPAAHCHAGPSRRGRALLGCGGVLTALPAVRCALRSGGYRRTCR
jgi:hypothetical protein